LAKIETITDVNLIGVGTTVNGKIDSNGSVRIDGTVHGDITAVENLFVGETGEVEGILTARNVTIGGKIKGSITAVDKIIFESKSEVHAEIKAAKLIIDEGSKFDGKCTMVEPKQKTESQKVESQKSEGQKAEAKKAEAKKVEAQKTEGQKT
jgi:cytoskeletal protein CcmA (bactofilin family)